jgi:hypothetical protein
MRLREACAGCEHARRWWSKWCCHLCKEFNGLHAYLCCAIEDTRQIMDGEGPRIHYIEEKA